MSSRVEPEAWVRNGWYSVMALQRRLSHAVAAGCTSWPTVGSQPIEPIHHPISLHPHTYLCTRAIPTQRISDEFGPLNSPLFNTQTLSSAEMHLTDLVKLLAHHPAQVTLLLGNAFGVMWGDALDDARRLIMSSLETAFISLDVRDCAQKTLFPRTRISTTPQRNHYKKSRGHWIWYVAASVLVRFFLPVIMPWLSWMILPRFSSVNHTDFYPRHLPYVLAVNAGKHE